MAKITSQQLAPPVMGENLIMNSEFAVAQRGTSVSVDNGFGVDRWKVQLSGATASLAQTAFAIGQTDVPGNPDFYLKFDVTVGNGNARTAHRVEDVTNLSGENAVHGFWARGVNPGGGNCQVRVSQVFGTGGSPSGDVVTDLSTLTLTASWQFFEYPLTFASVSGKTLGTNNNDYLDIWFMQPSADAATDAWHIDLAIPKLEKGTITTPWTRPNVADEVARCQRFFQKTYDIGVDPGTSTVVGAFYRRIMADGGLGTGAAVFNWRFKVKMRAAPTVTSYSTTGASARMRNLTTGGDLTQDFKNAGTSGIGIRNTAITALLNEIVCQATAEAEL